MEQINKNPVNISSPNLINICIDGMEHCEIQGRFYTYYQEEPISFSGILELIWKMEQLFDDLSFPQASTKLRSFSGKEQMKTGVGKKAPKQIPWEVLMEKKGKKATFLTCVKFRQKSTWQGDSYWKEGEEKRFFSSVLEFIRYMEQVLGEKEGGQTFE